MPEHKQMQQSKIPDSTFQKQATLAIQTHSSNPYSIIQRARINPKSLTHADVMQLQRTIGNRAVGRLLSGIGSPPTAQQATVQRQEIPEEEGTCPSCMQRQEIPEEEEPLQGKMIETIQRQEIPEEEEPLQGKMAETVQRQEIPEEEEPLQCKMAETIQRQEIPEEKEPLQGKFQNSGQVICPSCSAVSLIQKQEIPEGEEPLQGKMTGTIQRQEIPEEEPLQTKRENNTGMPDNLKADVESLSGLDMSDVRVHYNSSKPAYVGALAYTQGTDVHVAPGQEKHLPHEAWHVVQQEQGRVRPTVQLKELAVNDDAGLEREADVMGVKALAQRAQLQGVSEEQEPLQSEFVPVQHAGPDLAIVYPSQSRSFGIQSRTGEQQDCNQRKPRKAKMRVASLTMQRRIQVADELYEKNIEPLARFRFSPTEINAYKIINNADAPLVTFNTRDELIALVRKVTPFLDFFQPELGQLPNPVASGQVVVALAQQSEKNRNGHALARHGPQMGLSKLRDRLTTGFVEGQFAPAGAMGFATGFVSHDAFLISLKAAILNIQAAYHTTANRFQPLVGTLKQDIRNLNGLAGAQLGEQKRRIIIDARAIMRFVEDNSLNNPNATSTTLLPVTIDRTIYTGIKNLNHNEADNIDGLLHFFDRYKIVLSNAEQVGRGLRVQEAEVGNPKATVVNPAFPLNGVSEPIFRADQLQSMGQIRNTSTTVNPPSTQFVFNSNVSLWQVPQHFPDNGTPGWRT
ncbi:MAG: DUF4157 domain-containing protein [Methanosarcina sp.]|nr:DUF4157 domain-containing protein [Methanosarcina sp.]MDD4249823.1 DUF4157 domain-containing protein [Methanosarcina sp.]